jgi:ferredoxin-NADP reductase
VAAYKIKLKNRSEVASSTMAFHFEKPDGFTFQPGQCGDFTLSNPPQNDAEGNKRSFSLACAPYEDDLFITTRMRDTAFKRSLKLIGLGTELDLEAPWGELTLHNDPRIPAVFLTGGIGITPVRSIVLQATHDKLAHPLFAFYSNRTLHEATFLDELTVTQSANPHFHLIATMTGVESSPAQWNGETGYITEAMLQRHLSDLNRPIYYLTGPPEMVTAMQKLLKAAGVKETSIRAEEFSGY